VRIFACVKDVPIRDARYELADDATWIDDTRLTFEINECDEYALEAAVRLRERHGGEVCILTVGPARADKIIRKALAVGAQRAIRIADERRQAGSPHAVATALAAVLRDQSFDLVAAGTRSDDMGNAQTGVVLAQLLGVPHATLVVDVDAEPDAPAIVVQRELESGRLQRLRLPMPAVITVQGGSTPLRYPTMGDVLAAKKKKIDVVDLQSLGIRWSDVPQVTVRRLTVPVASRRAELLEGKPDEVSALLVKKLQEARVL